MVREYTCHTCYIITYHMYRLSTDDDYYYYFDKTRGWCSVVAAHSAAYLNIYYTCTGRQRSYLGTGAHICAVYLYERKREKRARVRTICPEQLASDIMADDVYLLCAYNITLETMCSAYARAQSRIIYEYIYEKKGNVGIL